MRIDIKVIPNAKKNIIKEDAVPLKVYLSAPAVDGKANAALVDFLAEHYGVRKSQVSIIKGLKTRLKTINISAQ
jgi:uncharacterized protein